MSRGGERSLSLTLPTIVSFLGWVGVILFLPQFWQQFWQQWPAMRPSLAAEIFLIIGGGTLLSAIVGVPVLAMGLPILWWQAVRPTKQN
ncbi:hypothetical protein [Haladaptatus sp. NG-WS-4]